MGKILSFWNLKPLGRDVNVTSVPVTKLILHCSSVLADVVDSSLAGRDLELQFHTTDDKD
jgi:hypothetical protein